jgi:hypothetical protein
MSPTEVLSTLRQKFGAGAKAEAIYSPLRLQGGQAIQHIYFRESLYQLEIDFAENTPPNRTSPVGAARIQLYFRPDASAPSKPDRDQFLHSVTEKYGPPQIDAERSGMNQLRWCQVKPSNYNCSSGVILIFSESNSILILFDENYENAADQYLKGVRHEPPPL